jgi:hypothetical protein
LGLSDGEFFDLTPREFDILLKRHNQLLEHTELQTGIITSNICNFIANWSMHPPKKGLELVPHDFMASKVKDRVVVKPDPNQKQKWGKREQRRVASYRKKNKIDEKFTNSIAQVMKIMTEHGRVIVKPKPKEETPNG